MRYAFLFISITICNSIFAQKEGFNWAFGNSALVSFNLGYPVATTNSSMLARYGCASISSASGKLLFYSQGQTVWGSNNTLPNGTGLSGDNIYSVQSVIFVPYPDSTHLLYIFTLPHPGKNRLNYSLINLKLGSGPGDIITNKKNISVPTLSMGKISAIRHSNRKDYWVLSPYANSDRLDAYLITSKGIDTVPISSKIGFKFTSINNNSFDSMFGYFKFSPDGKWIANVAQKDSFILARFDAATGKVYNVWKFKPSMVKNGIGIEFSPKSNYLYVSDFNRVLYQYDLTKKTNSEFSASRKIVDSSGTIYDNSCFQVAPDAKIYISLGQESFLHVIHAPDSSGSKARFQKNYFALASPSYTTVGLPDFIQSYFQKKSFGIFNNCSRDSTFFKISDTYQLDSALWDFGDPSSGAVNTSSKTTGIYHCYKNFGTYTVKLITYHKNFSDTISETFILKYSKLNFPSDTAVCFPDYISLGPNDDFTSYKWNTGSSLKRIFVNNPGTYNIKVTDFDGCQYSDTITVKRTVVKADFIISDSTNCFKNNLFLFNNRSKITNDINGKFEWYLSDGSTFIDTTFNKTFLNTGKFQVKLVTQSQLGCKDSITKTVSVYPNTKVDFRINSASQCLNAQSFDFINTSSNSDSLTYFWDLADLNSSQKNFLGKTYSQAGKYLISQITTSSHNCKDTLTQSISVLPSPVPDFSWSIPCSKTKTQFTFSGSIPSSPISSTYFWRFPNTDTSSFKNPLQLLDRPGINKVKLELKSSNGCKAEITKDVNVLTQAKADFNVQDICEDSSVWFENLSKDGFSFNWKFGDGNTSMQESPKHNYLISGVTKTFNVTMVAVVPNGCSDSITKAITVNAKPKSDFIFTVNGNQVDFSALETSASLYQWRFGDSGTANTSNPKTSYTYSKFKPAKYLACLKVTNTANCISETCKEVSITGASSLLLKENKISLYPNPNNGSFNLDVSKLRGPSQVEIFNALGQSIYKTEIQQSSLINLKVATGLYMLKVSNDSETLTKTIIIKNW